MMVSLSIPHVVPARAFRTLLLLHTLALMSVACAAKWSRLSKVAPRIRGHFDVHCSFYFFVHFVRRESDDLGADRRVFCFGKSGSRLWFHIPAYFVIGQDYKLLKSQISWSPMKLNLWGSTTTMFYVLKINWILKPFIFLCKSEIMYLTIYEIRSFN